MKKVILFGFALVSLAACTSKTVYVTQTTEAPVERTTPTYEEPVSKEDLYIETINDEYPWVEDAIGGRSELIKLGKLICQAIDEGSTLEDFAMMALSNDVDPEMFGFVIGVGVVAFCPENEWFIEQYLS